MARIYFITDNVSDLSGGADFNATLDYNYGTAAAQSVSIAAAVTETSYCFSRPLHPGTRGSVTGNYTVSVFCSTANNNITGTATLRRINSAGTVQTSSATSSSVAFDTTGAKIFSFTSLNLGTFTATDRLRLDLAFTNAAAHSASSFGIRFNDSNSSVVTPFTVRLFVST